MTRPRLYWQLDDDLETGLRLLGQLERINDNMAATAPNALAAAAYDREHGGSQAWCDTHEREVTACRARRLACLGKPLPRYIDRVGDSITGQVLADAWAINEGFNMLHEGLKVMLDASRRYLIDHDPAAAAVAETVEDANKPKCQIHLRHGWDVDSETKEPTRLAHEGRYLLDLPLRLCQWCRRHVITNGELPNTSQVRQHATKSCLPQAVIPHTNPVDVRWTDDGAASVVLKIDKHPA